MVISGQLALARQKCFSTTPTCPMRNTILTKHFACLSVMPLLAQLMFMPYAYAFLLSHNPHRLCAHSCQLTTADGGNTQAASSSGHADSGSNNGFSVVAHTLAKLGIKHMYGVVGIPVTELASAAQVPWPSLECTSCHACCQLQSWLGV